MEKEEIVKEIVNIIHQNLEQDYKIFLFGSQARGDGLETSDIDIGILGAREVPWKMMVKIKAAVEGIATLRQIDIVDLKAGGEEFSKRALAQAKEIS